MDNIIGDIRLLLHPYYVINILLSVSYVVSKTVPQLCYYIFPGENCEMTTWESEVLFFLLVIIIFRTRKSGSRSAFSYISTASMYAKVCNIILWFSSDPVKGIIYIVISLVHFLVVGEPVFKGPEKVTYFCLKTLDEELNSDKNTIWIIGFYTVWNSTCTKLAPVFAKLSMEYSLSNLKFGKVDVGRYPDVAKVYHINTTPISLQLPTISIFKEGKEVCRRPCLDTKGKFLKFYFTEDNIRASFDLNNIYAECVKNEQRKDKHAKSE